MASARAGITGGWARPGRTCRSRSRTTLRTASSASVSPPVASSSPARTRSRNRSRREVPEVSTATSPPATSSCTTLALEAPAGTSEGTSCVVNPATRRAARAAVMRVASESWAIAPSTADVTAASGLDEPAGAAGVREATSSSTAPSSMASGTPAVRRPTSSAASRSAGPGSHPIARTRSSRSSTVSPRGSVGSAKGRSGTTCSPGDAQRDPRGGQHRHPGAPGDEVLDHAGAAREVVVAAVDDEEPRFPADQARRGAQVRRRVAAAHLAELGGHPARPPGRPPPRHRCGSPVRPHPARPREPAASSRHLPCPRW